MTPPHSANSAAPAAPDRWAGIPNGTFVVALASVAHPPYARGLTYAPPARPPLLAATTSSNQLGAGVAEDVLFSPSGAVHVDTDPLHLS